MKNLIFAIAFLIITSAFITVQAVRTKEPDVKVEKNSMMPKGNSHKWRATAKLEVQRTKDGVKREITGRAGCEGTWGKGGYDYEVDAKDAAKKDAEKQMKEGETEIKCTYTPAPTQDCSSKD